MIGITALPGKKLRILAFFFIHFRCPSASKSFAPVSPHLEKPSRNGQKFQKVAQLRPTLLRSTIAIASTYCICLTFFHSSFIKCSRTSHKKRPSRLGNAAQRNDDAFAKLIIGTFATLTRSGKASWISKTGPSSITGAVST